jgi:NAD(P)-dependent dehydrogenase (short-subunit alcohol dehydrogenase family)
MNDTNDSTVPPVCLITGATRGLGRAVAEALAHRGSTVIIGGRDPEAVARAATDSGAFGRVEALAEPLDVASRDTVDRAAVEVAARFGRLDVLVNNAAAYVDWSESASGADLAVSRTVMDTNLYGAWNMIQAFLPMLLLSAHPRIVNVGAAATYGVSKAALHALTATFAAELADTPVIVNAVDPDLTATWPGAESMGARPVSESVPGIVWAATLPDDGPRGSFFRDGHPHPW